MPPRVERATPESFEGVLPLLRAFEARTKHLSDAQWKRLFWYPWEAPDQTRGFLLMDGERIVGFEALIQHYRTIQGQRHRLANGSSWVVDPSYRRHSMLIRRQWFQLETEKGVTGVALTSRRELTTLLRSLGYRTLDTHQWILIPPVPLPSRGWKTADHPPPIEGLVSPQDLQIYEDHRSLPCRHLFLWRDDRYCYVVSARRAGSKGLPTSFLFYISHPEVFVSAQSVAHRALSWQNRAVWVTADERLFRGSVPARARKVPLSLPRLFASQHLEPFQIDNLYSELILLEL